MSAAPASRSCDTCRAPVSDSLVCRFCGTPVLEAEDAPTQLKMLRQLHRHISTSEPNVQARLLSTGFVPSSADVLIEAGIQCVPLLHDDGNYAIYSAAARRLEAILLRLRLTPGVDPKVVRELEGQMREYRRMDRRNLLLGIAAVAGVAAIVLAVWHFH